MTNRLGSKLAPRINHSYKIAKFKVDGNCYEIYGTNKDGKKVEIYFDTRSLDVVKAEIEK